MAQGPLELHREILWDRQTEPLVLSEAAVLGLLWTAYAASHSPEEGRFPRVVLFVPLEGNASTFLRFEPPIALTESALRRLAPGIPGRPHALIVDLESSELVLRGTAVPEGTGYRVADERAAWFTMNSHALGLYLEIVGPGHLLATDRSRQPYVTHRLRSCTVSTVWDATQTAPFTRVIDGVIALARADGGILGLESLRAIVGSFFAHVMRMVIDARHGGTFAVVPTDFSISENPAVGTARIRIDPLPGGVLGMLDRGGEGGGRFGVTEENEWWESHHVHEALSDLRTYARSVGALAAMDGTVFLSENLAVIGAGVMTSGIELPRCVEVDHGAGEIGEFRIRDLGSRNQSAARFCGATGATIFVVSEDGDLRIYYRREDRTVGVMPNVGLHAGSSPAFE